MRGDFYYTDQTIFVDSGINNQIFVKFLKVWLISLVLNENIQVWAEKTVKEPCKSVSWTFFFLPLTVLITGIVHLTMTFTWINMKKNRCECISNTKTLDDIKILPPNTLNVKRELWWEQFQIYLWTYYKIYFYNSLLANFIWV